MITIPDNLPTHVEPMTPADLGDVLEIERASFPSPWSARAYEYELRYNDMAHYFVARAPSRLPPFDERGMWSWLKRAFRPPPADDPLMMVGYIGYWLMAGEAHISTIAVHPNMRGRSYGELLLSFVIADAARRGAHVATLEVRVSNTNAQHLYSKYGFDKVGLRKAYYSDNNEDAFIMTTPPLNSAAYQQKFQRLETALARRLRERRPEPFRGGREASQVNPPAQ
jgi:ribosomal-protein-alanine N-acetyltransferase